MFLFETEYYYKALTGLLLTVLRLPVCIIKPGSQVGKMDDFCGLLNIRVGSLALHLGLQ